MQAGVPKVSAELEKRINQGLLAHPSLPANTIAELIALAKQKPGEITYGSSGLGAAGHVNGEAIAPSAGRQ